MYTCVSKTLVTIKIGDKDVQMIDVRFTNSIVETGYGIYALLVPLGQDDQYQAGGSYKIELTKQ